VSATARELDAMRRAIALSALGLGSTSPNPPVGCVILDRAGDPVGEGYHLRKGESHAEVNALAAAGSHASGGTAVVTLEPCNHHGRTPPCHQALLDAGIARVLIALIDPTSRGDGGAARLRAAGVDVQVHVLDEEALVVLHPWLEALTSGRPRVRWIYEHGPDGPRECPASLLAQLRGGADAVLSADGHVEEAVPGAHGAGAFALPTVLSGQEPESVLNALYGGGVRSLLLHGNSHLAVPFLDRGLVDEINVVLPTTQQSASLAGTRSSDFLPSGFEIQSIQRTNAEVLISAWQTFKGIHSSRR
jgi:diaminohydroxyphosphoribosylaminopyrimidine deaminase / 5-amino-6-(5-phosphoribosylamino)uracil reductase